MTPEQFFNLIECGDIRVNRAYALMAGDFVAGAFLTELLKDAKDTKNLLDGKWLAVEPTGWKNYFCLDTEQFTKAINILKEQGFITVTLDPKGSLPVGTVFYVCLNWQGISDRLVALGAAT
jgi:hypothetical protein